MKAFLNFFFNIFNPESKNEYIGLSSFKAPENKKPEIKKEVQTFEKTSLTGLLKRVS